MRLFFVPKLCNGLLNVRYPETAGNIQRQPVNSGGIFGGICATRNHEKPEIAGHLKITAAATWELL
jgi:hypothetical protein